MQTFVGSAGVAGLVACGMSASRHETETPDITTLAELAKSGSIALKQKCWLLNLRVAAEARHAAWSRFSPIAECEARLDR